MPSVVTSNLSKLQKRILISLYRGAVKDGITGIPSVFAHYFEPTLVPWQGEVFTQDNANINERSVVSASLKKLEVRGLITRWNKDRLNIAYNPGRTAYVAFTDEGLALARELFQETVGKPEKLLEPQPKEKIGNVIGMLEYVKEKVELISEGKLPPESADFMVEVLARAIESLQDDDVITSPVI